MSSCASGETKWQGLRPSCAYVRGHMYVRVLQCQSDLVHWPGLAVEEPRGAASVRGMGGGGQDGRASVSRASGVCLSGTLLPVFVKVTDAASLGLTAAD